MDVFQMNAFSGILSKKFCHIHVVHDCVGSCYKSRNWDEFLSLSARAARSESTRIVYRCDQHLDAVQHTQQSCLWRCRRAHQLSWLRHSRKHMERQHRPVPDARCATGVTWHWREVYAGLHPAVRFYRCTFVALNHSRRAECNKMCFVKCHAYCRCKW